MPLPYPSPACGGGDHTERAARESERTESGAEPNAGSRVVMAEDQRGRDPC